MNTCPWLLRILLLLAITLPSLAHAEPPGAIDLSVPRLEPKQLAWEGDFKADETQKSKAQETALRMKAFGDRFKSAGEYEDAEQAYDFETSGSISWCDPNITWWPSH